VQVLSLYLRVQLLVRHLVVSFSSSEELVSDKVFLTLVIIRFSLPTVC